MNKIKELYEWFSQFDNNELLIKTSSRTILLKINKKSLPYLIGLQYINPNNVKMLAHDLVKLIETNDDEYFYKLIEENNHTMLRKVKDRIEYFKSFLGNLENSTLINNKKEKSTLSNRYLLVQQEDGKIMYLELLNVGYEDVLIEFEVIDLFEDIDIKEFKLKNIDEQSNENIVGIYKYKN